MSKEITARAKAFRFSPVQEYRFKIDDDGTVRVWDSVAGHFTTLHSLSASAQRRIAALAHPRVFVRDDALYFTDNGRIVCGRHCGSSARFSGRDISGQKIKRVTADDASAWQVEVGEPIQCEDCGAGIGPPEGATP